MYGSILSLALYTLANTLSLDSRPLPAFQCLKAGSGLGIRLQHTYACILACTHAHTYAHTYVHTHAHTHMHIYTHIHTVGSFLAGWPFSLIIRTYTWNEGYLMIEILSITMCALSCYMVVLLMQGLQPIGYSQVVIT